MATLVARIFALRDLGPAFSVRAPWGKVGKDGY